MFNTLNQKFERIQFTRGKQKAFLEDLCSLIEDGVPATQAIDTISQISEGITKTVAADILQSISQGQPLAEGMKAWFSRPLVEVIRAGESGGTLPETLHATTKSFSQQTNAIAMLVQSLIYPIVVLIVALGVSVFIKNSVLDNFAQIKPIQQWPDVGRTFYDFANITQHWWWLIVLLMIVIVIFVARMLKHWTGKSRKLIDRFLLL